MTGLISVIHTTYQREEALDVTLRALSRQTDCAFEVIGAGRRVAQADIPIRHVWQETRDRNHVEPSIRLKEMWGR